MKLSLVPGKAAGNPEIAIKSLNIAVLGDFALDAYWFVDMAKAELSRETSIFNRPVVKESYSMGGSANVAWNLADLGVKQVSAFSALGNDWRGRLLKELMMKAGIQLEGCITPPDWSTVLFIKILLQWMINNRRMPALILLIYIISAMSGKLPC